MRVAVVTDSTAYLPADLVAQHDLRVVPLRVLIGHATYREDEVAPGVIAAAMRAHTRVTTSRPPPEEFAAAYRRAAEDGYDAVVSVHLSAELSGTWASACLAAASASVPVEVVDTRSLGLGLGFAALTAADVVTDGGTAKDAAHAAARHAGETSVYFGVDTLDPLRRGGRIGAASALLGSALAIKPLLALDDGRIVPVENVRTSARALERLGEIAIGTIDRARPQGVRVGVHHLDGPDRAAALAAEIAEGAPEAPAALLTEVGAAVGAHVGPGMLGAVVAPSATITLGNSDKA